eukprot:5698428-Lingulodinium_polyedra.AAC.1
MLPEFARRRHRCRAAATANACVSWRKAGNIPAESRTSKASRNYIQTRIQTHRRQFCGQQV